MSRANAAYSSLSSRPALRPSVLAAVFLIAGFLLAPALIELPFLVSKGYNEGWGAFLATHALDEKPLYPKSGALYANNYPPVSFYVIAGLGSLIGDHIIAGRLLSIVGVFWVGASIAAIVRLLGGQILVALFSGLLFVAYLAAYHGYFVGMNEPQLLGHAIMLSGLIIFLRGGERRPYLFLTALVMLIAGLVKHNLIALPIALTIWLFLHARKDFGFWLLSSFLLLSTALLILFLSYGEAFFVNIVTRGYSLALAVHQFVLWISPLHLYLTAAFLLVLLSHQSPGTILVGLYVLIAGIWGFFISGGDGVWHNAVFDLVIAVVIASGLFIGTFAHRCQERWPSRSITHVLVAILCLPILLKLPHTIGNLKRALTSLPRSEQLVAEDVAFIAGRKGPVLCENLALCYWAGKTLEADFFNLGQKLKAGLVSESALIASLENRAFSLIQMDAGTGTSFRLPQRINEALSREYVITRSSRKSGVFLEPAKNTR